MKKNFFSCCCRCCWFIHDHVLWLYVHIESINESTGLNTVMMFLVSKFIHKHKPVSRVKRNVLKKTDFFFGLWVDKGKEWSKLKYFLVKAEGKKRSKWTSVVDSNTLRTKIPFKNTSKTNMSFFTWKRFDLKLFEGREKWSNISNDEVIVLVLLLFFSIFYYSLVKCLVETNFDTLVRSPRIPLRNTL